jgi:hypothetical protein
MIVFRGLTSRAEAGANPAQFNGRLSGPRWPTNGRGSHLAGGAVAVGTVRHQSSSKTA